MDAIDYYLEKTNRKLFFEYILIDNENDSMDLARELVAMIHKIKKRHLIHVNLILYNQTDGTYKETSKLAANKFKNHLLESGISTTIRKNLGRDINGACGQLALTVPLKKQGVLTPV